MFRGLSAFPLTPITPSGFDEKGFIRILQRIVDARVDSIGALGSTGSYTYLTREQRKHIASLTIAHADTIPVMVCIGAINTDQVLHLADDAQHAGASALLLPPVCYQPLSDDEVFGLFETVTRHVSVPVCLYDNPGTTRFTFSDTLYRRIAELPGVRSIKLPALPAARIRALRQQLPDRISLGISGDASAGDGLNAGCKVWYSVCGGLFPQMAKAITDAAALGNHHRVTELIARLAPLWRLYQKHGGSIRVTAAAAGILGLTNGDCLPRPLLPLSAGDTAEIAQTIRGLGIE